MEIVAIIVLWTLISIPSGMLAGQFIANGTGDDETGSPPKSGPVGQNPAGCDGTGLDIGPSARRSQLTTGEAP